MKLDCIINGRSVVLDIPDDVANSINTQIQEQTKRKTGWELPQEDKQYWYIEDDMISVCNWNHSVSDVIRYNTANCFANEVLAKNIMRYQILDRKIRRRIAEICNTLNWNGYNKFNKYYIFYDHIEQELEVESTSSLQGVGWYFDSRNHAEQILKEFRKELIWYFTEFQDRTNE